MVVTSANDSQKSANVLLMTFCKWSWARFNLLMRKCKWLSSLQMTFANGVLMNVPSFLWTTTESTKHKKVEATSFDETCEEKKATSFEKWHEMKRKKRKNIWDSQLYFTSEAKMYLVSKNIIYHKTQNTKRQKKAKRQHLKTMDCDLFFLLKQ